MERAQDIGLKTLVLNFPFDLEHILNEGSELDDLHSLMIETKV